MKQITGEQLKQAQFILFIHTPFCGTCQVARKMLHQIESVHKTDIFYEMNASLFPNFMQENQVESVPCLLIKDQNKVKEKIYAFQSIGNIYRYLLLYKPELFANTIE